MEYLSYIFWLIFLLSLFIPALQKRLLDAQRYGLMRQLEKKRQSRLITMIHRQETISFLGIPLFRYISIEDSEEVLRAIRLTDPETPIDLILHTPGGLVLASEQIAYALKRHPAKVTVFVPHYAMSGGTLIALAVDDIVMDPNATLGPVDPQVGSYPAASILEAVTSTQPNARIDANTLILADVSRKAMNQIRDTVACLLEERPKEIVDRIVENLASGRWTHDYPISRNQAKEMGLPVSDEMPMEVYALMRLFPQTSQRRPSVEYIPIPYRPEPSPPVREPRNRRG